MEASKRLPGASVAQPKHATQRGNVRHEQTLLRKQSSNGRQTSASAHLWHLPGLALLKTVGKGAQLPFARGKYAHQVKNLRGGRVRMVECQHFQPSMDDAGT